MYIVAGILSLLQHKNLLQTNSEKYFINQCHHQDCGKSGLWKHGVRYRKSDRESKNQETLNPIAIQRLYCPSCKRTCSVLPECIPKQRWYLFIIQQIALQLYLNGQAFNKINQSIKPSRQTISRWINKLKENFNKHALQFKSKWSDLGYYTNFNTFWSALLKIMSLSQAMLFLHTNNGFVP